MNKIKTFFYCNDNCDRSNNSRITLTETSCVQPKRTEQNVKFLFYSYLDFKYINIAKIIH
jgi:hypothetical protein